MFNRILKNRKGFTLIELIVVLGVLAIIMSISVPKYMSVKEQAKIDADIATLGQIAKLAELYYIQGKITKDEYKDTAGTAISEDFKSALEDYMSDIKFQSNNYKLAEIKLYINNGVATVILGELSFPNTNDKK